MNNLRTETYTEDSRIPATSIGTPAEDAQRRDFTVNALFYNINDGKVEDLTGRGLQDLQDGLIRTPLPASTTFRDDPLRMLRAIRFASRLGFRLDDALVEAASDASMHQLLETKVSRERFGIEVDKMMKAKGSRPVAALSLMQAAQLLRPVFLSPEILAVLPEGQAPPSPGQFDEGLERARLVAELLLAEAPQEELRLVLYAALLSGFTDQTIPEKKKQKPLITSMLRAALKIDLGACEAVQDIAQAAAALKSCWQLDGAERNRCIGTQLRIVGERWVQSLALSKALSSALDEAARLAFLQEREGVCDSGLVGCWDWKPLIDGKTLMAPPFNVPKGRKVGEVMDAQLRWRLESPQLTEEECARRVHELVASWK